ncbi:pilus assembly protein [Sphingomonas sp. So64.6b]|uniref:TadE/TadG family type IV pilus assembly protein n=1 Tax=Sphingomonas sp. So64.6b TaxID=2997354 RepID=UPI0015FEEA2B|nr:TadE/TadG family type IV pilus assembly protein [Sphingomonas sp. So64.6b]QNA83671.1 pilus assembly protein [Sphingomonas sp. So64.6b]
MSGMKAIERAMTRGFMSRLRHDIRGNTLAIMAAALIPLAGLVGGGIDMSRMYITKTRLQHACDAGALAGRKAMGGGIWGSDDSDVAQKFFTANYQSGAYGSTGSSATFTESAGKVSGTASATLPMTLMKIFKKYTETLTVTCDAEMRLPNTDIMFVLDTTGSMASKAVSSDPDTKIVSLKNAVKCFYEIVARLNTDATCTTGTPSGGTGDQTQIRFGFVPYATNVNVGKLLPTSYFANSWPYQTRVRNGSVWLSWTGVNYTYPNGSGNCVASANTSTREYRSTKNYYSGYGYLCYNEARDLVPQWDYGQKPVDISGLKNGTSWNNSFTLPINDDGSIRTVDWDGCIEERRTAKLTNYSSMTVLQKTEARDLDIDLVPTQGDTSTLWAPALREVIFPRQYVNSTNQFNTAAVTSATNFSGGYSYACPAEARKMQEWPTASTFDTYVDSLTPSGNTYHDIGLLWGARLLSPTGLFASENALTPQGGEIERHLIFMTDGDTNASNTDYAAYGLPWFDRRQTSSTSAPRASDLNDQVNARFLALCAAVRNQNITLWVISFGDGSNATTEGRLETCASDGKFFTARDSATLQTTFASIADQISQLRLTR